MSLSKAAEKIRVDLTTALKAGEVLRTSVLRMLLSEMNYKQIDLGRDLTDEDIISVVGREVKKRREAIESYKQGGRLEQAKQEEDELVMLQVYLPEQMGEKEVEAEIDKVLTGLDTKEFGQVMKVVSPMFKGKADGAMVAKLVRTKLGL